MVVTIVIDDTHPVISEDGTLDCHITYIDDTAAGVGGPIARDGAIG
jgi:hypothetical protein